MKIIAAILLAGLLSAIVQAHFRQSANQDREAQRSNNVIADRDDEKKQAIRKRFREIADAYYAHPESEEARLRLYEMREEDEAEASKAWEYLRQRAETDVREHPDSAEAWHRIGRLNIRGHDRRKAKEAFEKAIALKPDYAEAYNGLGLYYEWPSWCGNTYFEWSNKERDFYYGNAVASQQKAIQLKPDYFVAYAALGDTYWWWKRYEDAVIAYRQAIKINSNDKWSYHQLGDALQHLEQDKEAIEIFERVVQQNADAESRPSRGSYSDLPRFYLYSAYRSLAELYRKTGSYRQALETYKFLEKAGINSIHLRIGLAFTYVGLGDKSSALAEYQILLGYIKGEQEGAWKKELQQQAAELLDKIERMQ